jgi:hypothetical protein
MRFRCVAIFKTQGVVAFATLEPAESVRETPGTYTSTVRIPGHLLTEDEYIVGVSILASRGAKLHYVQVPEAVTFQTTDPMRGTSARGDYAERIGGVVRPRLTWEMQRVDDEATAISIPVMER